jgi:hypothetical protein
MISHVRKGISGSIEQNPGNVMADDTFLITIQFDLPKLRHVAVIVVAFDNPTGMVLDTPLGTNG